MICACGSTEIVDITTQDDPVRQFLCQRCGKKAGASEFVWPASFCLTRWERFRDWLAGVFIRIAQAIAP